MICNKNIIFEKAVKGDVYQLINVTNELFTDLYIFCRLYIQIVCGIVLVFNDGKKSHLLKIDAYSGNKIKLKIRFLLALT